MNKDALEETLLQLVEDYHDVTPSSIEVYQGPFDSSSFGRIVARGRPCILKNGLPNLAASSWTAERLCSKMGDRKVDVAVTPDGLADSIVSDRYFVEPYTTSLPFSEFISLLEQNASYKDLSNSSSSIRDSSEPSAPAIVYLQSQNDNLRLPPTSTNDLSPLYSSVLEPGFASDFFDKSPEAINIWIGDERSVTSLHRDSSYHNLYTIVRGSKKFTMFAPIEEPLVYEKQYPHATYVPVSDTNNPDELDSTAPFPSLRIQPTEPPLSIPWPSVNPLLEPHSVASIQQLIQYPLFAHARPLIATLERGDTLYMPPAWWHAVEQRSQPVNPKSRTENQSTPNSTHEDDEDEDEPPKTWQPCIALNWWYDRDIGLDWATMGLISRLSKTLHDDSVEESPQSDNT